MYFIMMCALKFNQGVKILYIYKVIKSLLSYSFLLEETNAKSTFITPHMNFN